MTGAMVASSSTSQSKPRTTATGTRDVLPLTELRRGRQLVGDTDLLNAELVSVRVVLADVAVAAG